MTVAGHIPRRAVLEVPQRDQSIFRARKVAGQVLPNLFSGALHVPDPHLVHLPPEVIIEFRLEHLPVAASKIIVLPVGDVFETVRRGILGPEHAIQVEFHSTRAGDGRNMHPLVQPQGVIYRDHRLLIRPGIDLEAQVRQRSILIHGDVLPRLAKIKKTGVGTKHLPLDPAFDRGVREVREDIGRQFHKAVGAVKLQHALRLCGRSRKGEFLVGDFRVAHQFSSVAVAGGIPTGIGRVIEIPQTYEPRFLAGKLARYGLPDLSFGAFTLPDPHLAHRSAEVLIGVVLYYPPIGSPQVIAFLHSRGGGTAPHQIGRDGHAIEEEL